MKMHALTVLGLTIALAACGSETESNETAATNTASPAVAETNATASDMGKMEMSATAKMAKGTGKVTAIDKSAGTITLNHGPIAEANWPAMTMGFKAAPGMLDSVQVGDKVAFDLKIDGGSGEVTAISQR